MESQKLSLYDIAVMGQPEAHILESLRSKVCELISMFEMKLGSEVGWYDPSESFNPNKKRSTVIVFFGNQEVVDQDVEHLVAYKLPILPVVSNLNQVSNELPHELRHLNCLASNEAGIERLASALLECIGLLPRQRRVFVSYRRNEAREAALQLFDSLSARLFDVFLDTHGVPPSEDFQAMLWHRLCDSDVLLMLDTPEYFESRWTAAEYGRAMAKGISVLRVSWPGVTPSPRTQTACSLDLKEKDVDNQTGLICDSAIEKICYQLEKVRSESQAVRNVNIVSNLRIALEKVGGELLGIGTNKAIFTRLADQREITVYPSVGVPNSTSLHFAEKNANRKNAVVIYDHIGLHTEWQEHLDWLGSNIKSVKWVKLAEAAWQFADWED